MSAQFRLAALLAFFLASLVSTEAHAQSPAPSAPKSELEQVIQAQQVAFPPFRGVWSQEMTFYGKSQADEFNAMVARLKVTLTKLDAEIAQEKDAALRAKQEERQKNLKKSIEELEKTPNSLAKEKSPDRKSVITVSATYLSPERFIITIEETVGKTTVLRSIYRNNGPVYSVTDPYLTRQGTVTIDKYRGKFLESLPLALPGFAIDQLFEGLLEDFQLKKEQDDKGMRFSGSFQPDIKKLMEEEKKEVTPEIQEKISKMGPARISAVFDESKNLKELVYTQGEVNKISKTYSNYTDKDGVRVPEIFEYESIMEKIDGDGGRQHISVKVLLKEFHKLTEAEMQSTSAAYQLKPGYRVTDNTGSQPIQTTSDELLKATSTTK